MLNLFIFSLLFINTFLLALAAPKAWEPEERNVPLHQQFLAETKAHAKDIQIVFYGDSITHGWSGNGKKIWDSHYGKIHSVNYGIGGDKTQHIIWRMQNGEIDGLSSKVIVLMIGINNVGHDSDEDIAAGIKRILDILHQKLQFTKVLLLGVLPASNLTVHVKSINAIIKKYDNGNIVRFLDMGPHFVDATGKLKDNLYDNDHIHLTEEGYQLWSNTMDQLLLQMITPVTHISLPWEPEDRSGPDHQELVEYSKKHGKDIQIVFFGDDIFYSFPKTIFNKHYSTVHAVNYGLNGDRTQHLIWRLSEGEFNGLTPKVIVIQIGGNNVGYHTTTEIARGIKTLIDEIKNMMPHTKILLTGILPRGEEFHIFQRLWFHIIQINAMISVYDNADTIRFLDMSPLFEDSDGEINAELYTDGVHLSEEGYELLSNTIDPLLKQMLAAPPHIPLPWEPEESNSHGHRNIIAYNKIHAKEIQILFYGDSITMGWNIIGKALWIKHYVPLHAVNYAIASDRTQNILWRLANGELNGLNPKLFVLNIGTNNVDTQTPENIAKGIKAILTLIHAKLPNTKILLLSIFPRVPLQNKIKKVNELISINDNGKTIRFLDMSLHFEDSAGHIKPGLFADGFHLTAAGFSVWYHAMEALFRQMLNLP